jgi:hypothetical protein
MSGPQWWYVWKERSPGILFSNGVVKVAKDSVYNGEGGGLL